MRYRILGKTGLSVSELCLGTMTFGGKSDMWRAIGVLGQKESTELVARALDAGINFFDTADGYGDGESEEILGKALGNRRKEVIVATKVGFPNGPGPNDRGLSRKHILDAVDASLRRLGTDYIDLYQAHRRDPQTPLDKTMRAFERLVSAGRSVISASAIFPPGRSCRRTPLPRRAASPGSNRSRPITTWRRGTSSARSSRSSMTGGSD
jgi:aryl-alcohol dehydrogenase-like predicted oxidoreductase